MCKGLFTAESAEMKESRERIAETLSQGHGLSLVSMHGFLCALCGEQLPGKFTENSEERIDGRIVRTDGSGGLAAGKS